jgi:hypothetical protein
MSTNNRSQGAQGEKTYFEQQRELVLQDVATVSTSLQTQLDKHMLMSTQNLEQVLQNMNTLNRSLESVIAVCFARCLPIDRSSRGGRTPPTSKLWNEIQETPINTFGSNRSAMNSVKSKDCGPCSRTSWRSSNNNHNHTRKKDRRILALKRRDKDIEESGLQPKRLSKKIQ